MRKGTSHRAFSLTGRCSTSLSGCVLPEVTVLELIQWNSISHFYQIQRYGQNQNHVYLWLHSGTPEGQGNTQLNLKGSEGCDGNHQDPLSKDNLVPVRHLPPSIYPSGKRVAHHWGPLFQLLPPRCRHSGPVQSKEGLVTVFDSGAESNGAGLCYLPICVLFN